MSHVRACAAHAGVGLPTLGNTNMKFNSSRWTRAAEAEGLSIFDMKGAMSAIQDVRYSLHYFVRALHGLCALVSMLVFLLTCGIHEI